MTLDDVWGHAQNVRMWLATAQQCFDGAKRTGLQGRLLGWLSRGQVGKAQIDEGVDAIGKARLAFLDLQFALRATDEEPVQLDSLGLELGQSDLGVVARVRVREGVAAEARTAVMADLYVLDRLCADIEARQRAAR